MTSPDVLLLHRERDQLRPQLAEARLFRNNLRHQWLLADPFTRAQLEIRIEQIDQHIRDREWRLDEIDAQLRQGGEEVVQPPPPPPPDLAFLYDVCISGGEAEPALTWLWEELVPRLEAAGLRFALAGEAPPGVSRLDSAQHTFTQSRRVLALLTEGYLASNSSRFESIMAQAESIRSGLARLIPVFLEDIDLEYPPAWVPLRLNPLVVNPVVLGPAALARGQRIPRLDPWAKLAETLRGPLPTT